MTDNHDMVVPLMAVAILAAGISRLISPTPIYHALAEIFLARLRTRASDGGGPP
jgi:H+/Cl- antiporter ClcA